MSSLCSKANFITVDARFLKHYLLNPCTSSFYIKISDQKEMNFGCSITEIVNKAFKILCNLIILLLPELLSKPYLAAIPNP